MQNLSYTQLDVLSAFYTAEESNQWASLEKYTKNHKEAYLLRFFVKSSKEKSDDNLRFQDLFSKMKMNLSGSNQFLSEQVSYTALDYIKADMNVRNFDLVIFWKHVLKEHPKLNLPDFDSADLIRDYLEKNKETVAQITVLRMNGIFEVWADWHKKYGETHDFPSFKTEREIHDYLEDDKNKPTIFQIIAKERDLILKMTTRLPAEIKYFVNLEELVFSNRKSPVLPKEFYTLPKLKVFKACHSELQKLSKKIDQLKELKELRLIGTQFTDLPDSFFELNSTQIIIENKTMMQLSKEKWDFLNSALPAF